MRQAFTALWERIVYRFWSAVAADFELRLEQELATSRLELASLAEEYRKSGAWEAMKVAQDAISESYAIAERVHTTGNGAALALTANDVAEDDVNDAATADAKRPRSLGSARKSTKGGRA